MTSQRIFNINQIAELQRMLILFPQWPYLGISTDNTTTEQIFI